MIKEKELIGKLQSVYGNYLYHKQTLPKPYFEDLKNVRVILLGSNPISLGANAELDSVFNLHNFNKSKGNSQVFSRIYSNMVAVDLELWDIYSQNLCKNYLINLSVHDEKWDEIARLWADVLKIELDILFAEDIPVLITAPWILKPLCENVREPKYYYEHNVIIKAEDNKLGRTLIPFFRQEEFDLSHHQWEGYRNHIKELLK